MDIPINRKVCQILWDAILPDFGYHSPHFENETFEIRPYYWSGEGKNDYHFYHKPSGFKISWYKYALRDAHCNFDITYNQFVDILYDCHNSLQEGAPAKITYNLERWWDDMKYTKTEMYDILSDEVGLGQDTMDILIKIMGDSNETYKKILTKMTDCKTFDEWEDSRRII